MRIIADAPTYDILTKLVCPSLNVPLPPPSDVMLLGDSASYIELGRRLPPASRGHVLNLRSADSSYKTVEFRYHAGTPDAEIICSWVRVVCEITRTVLRFELSVVMRLDPGADNLVGTIVPVDVVRRWVSALESE